jgi:hypothetical protein
MAFSIQEGENTSIARKWFHDLGNGMVREKSLPKVERDEAVRRPFFVVAAAQQFRAMYVPETMEGLGEGSTQQRKIQNWTSPLPFCQTLRSL